MANRDFIDIYIHGIIGYVHADQKICTFNGSVEGIMRFIAAHSSYRSFKKFYFMIDRSGAGDAEVFV